MLGTLVRDKIMHPAAPDPVRAWGGIAYALAALEVALPAGWIAVPILKIGRDLRAAGTRYILSHACVDDTRFLRAVPEPNNRVELRYTTSADRVEFLRGGVPGWSSGEVAGFLPGLDALYVNFISGMELTLAGARRIRDAFEGPSHADLHSLFLGVESDGRRSPRYLRSCGEWAGCFDTVQMNEDEFALFSRGAPDPLSAAARAFGGRARMIAVTRGSQGVQALAVGEDGEPAVCEFPTSPGAPSGDPTGCGDVWGAAFFSGVLAGVGRSTAISYAQTLAGCKLGSSGASRTRDLLTGKGPRPPWDSR